MVGHRSSRTAVLALLGVLVVTAGCAAAANADGGSGAPSRSRAAGSSATGRASSLLSAPPGSTDDHAWSGPSGPVTTGLGDVDGDGRPDRIIVNAQTGSVTVHTAAEAAANVQLKFGGGRLEGVSDLARTGRGLILIASSASGCCGYTADRAQVTVVGLLAGHLSRFAASDGSDPLSYNDGQGQQVEGFACVGHGIVTETHSAPYLPQALTDSWTTITYRLVGSTFTTISTRQHSGSPAQLGALTRNVGCSGISAINRAD